MYRVRGGKPEVLLVHPGGPFFQNKDDGAWSIPKGLLSEGEDAFAAAKREFEEETGIKAAGEFEPLGTITRDRDGKQLTAWAFEGDCDTSAIASNTCEIEWPPRSGKRIAIPEVDRGAFFDLATARVKINPYMLGILDAFESSFIQRR